MPKPTITCVPQQNAGTGYEKVLWVQMKMTTVRNYKGNDRNFKVNGWHKIDNG